jgi:hypothetical protein
LAEKAAAFMDKQLFNGEYYFQKVQYEGLKDTSFAQFVRKINEKSGWEDKLIKKLGPKYQYGTGCLSDGMLGIMKSDFYGIGTPMNRPRVKSALRSIFKYNFRRSLREHSNTQRPGYAMNSEPGLLLCTWPRGGKHPMPFPYSDEVWTGFEYQAAAHMIREGLVDEGLSVVRAARLRYDGKTRDPFNEYECGSYYARAMSSYALIAALSGFHYSAVTGVLELAPKLKGKTFQTFFSSAKAWGTIAINAASRGATVSIRVEEGELPVSELKLKMNGKNYSILVDMEITTGHTYKIQTKI